MNSVDVFILRLPDENKEWFQYCIESMSREAVTIRMVGGVYGHIGKGRKKGFALGTAPYVAYVDPDDLVCRGAFKACVDALEAAPDKVLAYTREARISEGGVLLSEWDRKLYEPFFGTPDEALRAHHLSVYRRAALPDLSFLDDYPNYSEQALKTRLWNNNFVFVDRVGYQWRRHPNNSASKIPELPEHIKPLARAQNELWRRVV